MNRFRPSLFISLIALSLLLLGALEGIWLRQVYQEKSESLSSTVDHILTRSVQEVQDSLIQAFVFNADTWEVTPSKDGKGLDSTIHLNFGTIDYRTIDQKEESEESASFPEKKESTTSIVIKTLPEDSATISSSRQSGVSKAFSKMWESKSSSPKPSEVKGSLSIFLQQKQRDSVEFELQELISLRLNNNEELQEIGLPFLLEPESDSQQQNYSYFVTNRFRDVPSGETFTVSLAATPEYILKEMWPELGFAFVLFSLITTAFLLIYAGLRKQQRLTQLKNDFISNITHELKTPITTVRVAVEALQSFDALANPQRTQEYLDISRQELDRLNLLVDRVLKMSLFEREKMEIKPEQVDMQPLLSSILSTMQLQFQKFRAKVELDVQGAEFNTSADRLHLTSVIVNLLDNALKYSPQSPEIEVRLLSHATEIQLDIQDNGLGIPKAYQEKIFDKFFRVPTGDRHDVKGHGLGLSYVAEVVRRHDGRIEVQSEAGTGTTFSLFLPKRGE